MYEMDVIIWNRIPYYNLEYILIVILSISFSKIDVTLKKNFRGGLYGY